MSAKTTISITEARRKFFDIAEEVQKPGTYYILTDKGRPKAVMMSVEEFESWQETLEVMQDFPDLKKDLDETEKAIKTGAYKKWISLDQLLAREGFVIADKSKKKYAIRPKSKTKRSKKA
ncbi:MAG: type II toxin-antitoxin system Phd/YefM family antitoxin [Parcubacteria group bacterium]|jgi:prevent-host-death family protein